MPVYLIRCGDKTKIGWSDDVDARRRQLQTSHHEDLVVIRTIDGDRATERWLHVRFAEHRLRGEWFAFHADMLTVIPPSAEPQPPKQKSERQPLVSWAADMCSRQRPCAHCQAIMATPDHRYRDAPWFVPEAA